MTVMDELTLERQIREKELKANRKLDKSWGITFDKITDGNLLLEMNIRYVQYVGQFSAFGTEYKIHQTMEDFNRFMTVMQKRGKKNVINFELPVARMNDGKFIYANRSSQLGIFSMEKEK